MGDVDRQPPAGEGEKAMKQARSSIAALLALTIVSLRAVAQQGAQDEALFRSASKIRKQIVTLSDYGVFDWITFAMAPRGGRATR